MDSLPGLLVLLTAWGWLFVCGAILLGVDATIRRRLADGPAGLLLAAVQTRVQAGGVAVLLLMTLGAAAVIARALVNANPVATAAIEQYIAMLVVSVIALVVAIVAWGTWCPALTRSAGEFVDTKAEAAGELTRRGLHRVRTALIGQAVGAVVVLALAVTSTMTTLSAAEALRAEAAGQRTATSPPNDRYAPGPRSSRATTQPAAPASEADGS